MDNDYIALVQNWGTYLLTQFSPAYLKPLYSLTSTLRSHLLPLVAKVFSNPDVASIVMLLILLLVSLKILDMLYRAVLFWVRLAVQIAIYGTIALVGFWVYTRGFEGAFNDAQELVNHYSAVWNKDYAHYKKQAEMHQRGGYAYGGRGREGWR